MSGQLPQEEEPNPIPESAEPNTEWVVETPETRRANVRRSVREALDSDEVLKLRNAMRLLSEQYEETCLQLQNARNIVRINSNNYAKDMSRLKREISSLQEQNRGLYARLQRMHQKIS